MKQIPEEILMKALELREEGKTPEQVLAAFPREAGDLKKYFDLVSELRAEAESIKPSPELLRSALRRAEAAREIDGFSAKPAVAGLLGLSRVPFGLRLLAPVLAVLMIFFLADRSQVSAPPGSPAGSPTPITETIDQVVEDAALEDTALPAAFRASDPVPEPQPPAVSPMSAMTPSGTGSSADSPSTKADRLVQSYIENAEDEEAILTNVFAEEQFEDPSGACTDAPDLSREQATRDQEADFTSLELSLASAPEHQKRALAEFGASLQVASVQRQLAIDVVTDSFRASVCAVSDDLAELRRLVFQYKADIGAITGEFNAKADAARATFGFAIE